MTRTDALGKHAAQAFSAALHLNKQSSIWCIQESPILVASYGETSATEAPALPAPAGPSRAPQQTKRRRFKGARAFPSLTIKQVATCLIIDIFILCRVFSPKRKQLGGGLFGALRQYRCGHHQLRVILEFLWFCFLFELLV